MNWKHEWKILVAGAVVLAALWLAPIADWPLPRPLLAALHLGQHYARAHVVWGILPALLIAGGLTTFLDRAVILRHLTARSNRWVAYAVASVSGTVLTACSCTVLPLFAGIYHMGAGLGPATTFLFAGPAVNVPAVALTASALGLNMAVARLVTSVAGSVIIGLIMAVVFRSTDAPESTPVMPVQEPARPFWQSALVLGLMVLAMVVINWSVSGRFSFALACCPRPLPKPIEQPPVSLKLLEGRLFYALEAGETNPYPARPLYHGQVEIRREDIVGETGDALTLRTAAGLELQLAKDRLRWVAPPVYRQGLVLSQDLDNVYIRDAQGQIHVLPRYTIQSALPVESALSVWLHRLRFLVAGAVIVVVVGLMCRWFSATERVAWLDASYQMGKRLLPRLLIGVVLTGLLLGCPDPARPESTLIPGLLPLGWVSRAAGGESLWANLVAGCAGAFMYLATLTEVPIVQGLLSNGLGKGPALALLLAGPALSLPSMLMIGGVLGPRRTAVFVTLVIGLSAVTGWAVGRWL
jgi:uncharacterized membrane protein YraQ (UPF0718 family)